MQKFIYLYTVLLLLILSGCSFLNKATDAITNRSAKERYQKDFKITDELYQTWENQIPLALNDSLQVALPYFEEGYFMPRSFPVYSYNIVLNPGERFNVSVESDSLSHLVFIDLYLQQEEDTLRTFKKIESAAYEKKTLSMEIEQPGLYKVVVQPAIDSHTPFRIKMKKSPVYGFPVAGATNRSIQSFWGATRGGGRTHEGIDIFAERGTPVVAVTDGRITSFGEKGLGGKQVWLRDPKRGHSLYYAHLDSIAPLGNSSVKTGDTIGFVGNTGNARTTSPHLHFGIYKGYRGAIDPLNYVYLLEEPDFKMQESGVPDELHIVTRSSGNLRDQPTTRQSKIIANFKPKDTLFLLGKTKEWFHIRTQDKQAAFIHESLVNPH